MSLGIDKIRMLYVSGEGGDWVPQSVEAGQVVAIITVITTLVSCSVNADIEGGWLFKGGLGFDGRVECPNMLIFQPMTYQIVNDCYGTDIANPIVEKGHWEVTQPNNQIRLNRTVIYSDVFFDEKQKDLTLKFDLPDKDTLHLTLIVKDKEVVRVYKKIK